jgi:hypothetical protein
MKIGRSLAQANTLPESIVRRQELAAAAVRTGPMTTIIIPRMKMSDLNIFSRPMESHFQTRGGDGGRFSKPVLLGPELKGINVAGP